MRKTGGESGAAARRQIKFSGFRKGVRRRTLFPPEKGFPRVTRRREIDFRGAAEKTLDIGLVLW